MAEVNPNATSAATPDAGNSATQGSIGAPPNPPATGGESAPAGTIAPPTATGAAAASAESSPSGGSALDEAAAGGAPTFEEANAAIAESQALNDAAITLTEAGPQEQQGFMHFIEQSDLVGKSLFGILVIMSLISWYIIIFKAASNFGVRRRVSRFLSRFWQSGSLEVVAQQLQVYGVRDPFSHLTQSAIQARDHYTRVGAAKLEDAGTESEFVMRSMRKIMDEETARLESGLTMLASIGSTAPFVGLFGTVWGVYHALVAIGMGGGATIDRIAGPVGEALIMTGLGLAVAIPAVLGFNAFVRRNRVLLARLDAFAYDLHTVLTTGQRVATGPQQPRSEPRQAA
ncbi:MAG: MotA/TolQ/ExbB proton channel family protein [Pigmentiphaga sp.]|nr:MotA/TolQ/ExbB proton channel family protein [Pigmentiphaga sp.]